MSWHCAGRRGLARGSPEAAMEGSKQMIVNKMAGPTINHHVVSSDRSVKNGLKGTCEAAVA
jgi:hypothetical protein